MNTRISKDRKHAGELLALLNKLEKDAAKDKDLDGHRSIIAHYDKAIKILQKKGYHGQVVADIIDSWTKERRKLHWYIALKVVSRLELLKTNLKTERDS